MVSLEIHEQQLASVHAQVQLSQSQSKQEAITESSPMCVKSSSEAPMSVTWLSTSIIHLSKRLLDASQMGTIVNIRTVTTPVLQG